MGLVKLTIFLMQARSPEHQDTRTLFRSTIEHLVPVVRILEDPDIFRRTCLLFVTREKKLIFINAQKRMRTDRNTELGMSNNTYLYNFKILNKL